jgi:hypothetical protein
MVVAHGGWKQGESNIIRNRGKSWHLLNRIYRITLRSHSWNDHWIRELKGVGSVVEEWVVDGVSEILVKGIKECCRLANKVAALLRLSIPM